MQKENEDIIKKVDSYFKEAASYRKDKDAEAREGQQFYDGHHWIRDTKRPYKNYVFQIIESETPVLTDSRPSTDTISIDPEREEAAKILDAAKKHVYREQCLNLKDSMSIKSSLIKGSAYQYVDWNPDLSDGEGDVVVKNLSFDQVFPDPTANEVQELRYLGFKFPTDIEEIKRRFPDAGKVEIISPDSYINAKDSSRFSFENKHIQNNKSDGTSRYKSESLTTIDEMWFKDYTMEKIPDDITQLEIAKESTQFQQGIVPDVYKFEDHEQHIPGHREQKIFIAASMLQIAPEQVTEQDIENLKQSDENAALLFEIIDDHIRIHEIHLEKSPKTNGMRPKYKNNLRVVIKVGSQVLYDGADPFEDGMYPLATFYCYKDEESFYGTGEAKNIIPIQKSLNEMDYSEYKGLKLNANSGWICDKNSGVDESTLTNEEGLVVIKAQGTEVRRIEPGQVSPQLANRKEMDKNAMREISGVNEAIMGQAPTNDLSGKAVVKLQQQAIGRIRLKSRILEEYTLPQRDKLILSRIMKFYTSERMLKIEDNYGSTKFIKFDPELVRDLKYDIIISPGSSAGYDKETVLEISKQLLAGQIIDARTFLDIADVPQRGKITKYLDENDQTQAMMQQLQQENLQLKAQFMPESLTPEEIEVIQQTQSQ